MNYIIYLFEKYILRKPVFLGKIDKAKIWDSPRTAEEIENKLKRL